MCPFFLYRYACYLYFQLKTHADYMSADAEDPMLHMASPNYIPPTTASAPALNTAASNGNGTTNELQPSPFATASGVLPNGTDSTEVGGGSGSVNFNTTTSAPAPASSVDAAAAGGDLNSAHVSPNGGEEYPQLSLLGALFSLTLITITVAACSEFLTGAIEAVSESSGINQAFLGLIILPIAGNACEHITAVFVAVKNKMDLAISVALGSSIQIATFVLPVTVLAGWAMGKELTLDFDPFAVVVLNCSVILAYFVSSDGSSNWLLGLQLVVTYLLIGAVYMLEDESQGGGGGDVPPSSPGFAAVVHLLNATMKGA
jgi:Ca2+/H+ antiporter